MNFFAPFFLARDAFWSYALPVAALSSEFVSSCENVALGRAAPELPMARTNGAPPAVSGPDTRDSDYLTSVVPLQKALPSPSTLPNELPQPNAKAAQWLNRSFEYRGDVHHAKVYIPSSYDGRPLPMVVMLHGGQQHPDDLAAGTQMNVFAEEEGFIVVYPEQSESANLLRCWNWFVPSNQARNSGETAALAALTNDLIVRFDVDRARVYVAGLSAGGAMAINLAVTYPDLYAAAAIHSGMAFGVANEHLSALWAMNDGRGKICLPERGEDTARTRTVPLIVFHGDADDTVHPLNGEQIIEMSQLLQGDPADTLVCTTTRVECEAGRHAYTQHVWRDQDGSLLAERWVVHGLGHAWSGGHSDGTYTDHRGPDATAAIVRFVSQFALDNVLEGRRI
ncbi:MULTISPECIES: PHB depolymerase family esterase [unclassified Caballeronia]|jgi:poly(hydroxyalkanoate) depolymerase family esterase|uniref:extracellular catalytic domain type 1 short-chain-length polyhydroxyalkanoate depolymerase n=1 Tax=unclassified Caballeronia TaxID=2646786 RepID=UPI00202893E2|nr:MULTISPECIES: PHB depolymerase family esterase [unclassified Caballeronia]